jgi:O-antigen/teichoic acid export membrane protein
LNPQPTGAVNNTATIARNSFWYGLELTFTIFAALVTSIAVARAIGPQRLDYFNYIAWLTNITATVGSFGLPMTARKYMAECLNQGQQATAHAVFRLSLKLQSLLAAGLTICALALVFTLGDPSQRVVSVLLVLNIAPRMIVVIPSQANNAAERMKLNTQPALISGLVTISVTWFSLWVGWGLYGVASALTLGVALESVLKLRAVHAWLREYPVGAIPPELKRRLFSFSGQGLVLMILNMVVWDRSDLVVLKALNHVPGQVTFFSLSFNLTERALTIPNGFGTSLGSTIMAQYGRGKERLYALTVSGAKYAFLLALPMLLGIACLSRPLILTFFGEAYRPMIPVLATAAALAVSKSLISPATVLLQATERQGFLILAGCAFGALDIGLDVLLTPSHGALGAAVANGAAQTLAAIAIWWRVQRLFRMDLRLGEFGRVALSGLMMAAVVTVVAHAVPGRAGLVVSILAGIVSWLLFLRLTRAVTQTDRERLAQIGRILPGRFRPGFERVVSLVAASAA